MATTEECKAFLVKQAQDGELGVSWLWDEDTAWDHLADEYINDDRGDEWYKMDPAEQDRLVAEWVQQTKDETMKIVTNPKNWKRFRKYKGEGSLYNDEGNVVSIREFICDEPRFSGEVGKIVLELTDGSLLLGEDCEGY